MAARQDQTLQIALIGSILGFILFFVLWYLSWKGYTESEQQVAELSTQLSGERGRSSNLQSENEDLREMIGFGRNDSQEAVQTQFKVDMDRYGAAYAEETRRFYRDILDSVYQDNMRTAAREAAGKEQIRDLADRLLAVETEKEKQVAQFQEAKNKAEADLAAQRSTFAADREALETTKKELLQNLDQQRGNYEAQLAEHEARSTELAETVGKLERALENLIAQQPADYESFEVADGRIAWVNQDGTVWINVGAADSLRRQVPFSVYDADEHDAESAAKKGSIEVTRMLGDHMAEARVTQDDPTNPILTGDLIYSPVWHRGKAIRFAFAGIIDIDDDGVSDLQLARDLVELNGGVVDAYITEEGVAEGAITVNTRYLVLGELPETVAGAKLQDSWTEFNKEAATMGVRTVTLDQFLNQIGYVPQDRAVRLGAGASADDFPAGREGRSSPSGESGAQPFRARTPYRTVPATPY